MMKWTRCWGLVLVWQSAFALALSGAPSEKEPAYKTSRRFFESGGVKILVDVYTPTRPAVFTRITRSARVTRSASHLAEENKESSHPSPYPPNDAATFAVDSSLHERPATPAPAASPPAAPTAGDTAAPESPETPTPTVTPSEAEEESSTSQDQSSEQYHSRAARHETVTAPPILVLHGAGGMLFDGPEMSRVAAALATAGFEAYQIHYFDRTHTISAREGVLLKLFPIWLATVGDAVGWVHAQRPDAPRIGIFGYSLGAFAAIETARRDPLVGAVVEEAGGFWHAQPEGPTRQPLPPMLVLHGTADRRVPSEKYTEPLLAFLREHHDPVEWEFFPGEGHEFSAAADAKVRELAVQFFESHLGRQDAFKR